MFAALLAFWNSVKQGLNTNFGPQTLEQYITSKNPTSTGDVEFWTAEYDNRNRQINRAVANGDLLAANWLRQNT